MHASIFVFHRIRYRFSCNESLQLITHIDFSWKFQLFSRLEWFLWTLSSGSTETKVSQISCINELHFLKSVLLLFISLICFSHTGSIFGQQIIRSGSYFNFYKSLIDQLYSSRDFSFNFTNCVNFSTNLTNYDSLRYSYSRQYDFLAIHPDPCVALFTSACFMESGLFILSAHRTDLEMRMNVMMINVISFDRYPIVSGFYVISYFVYWLGLFLEKKNPLISSLFSEVIRRKNNCRIPWFLPDNFTAIDNMKFSSISFPDHCLYVEYSNKDFWHVQYFRFLNVCNPIFIFSEYLK